MNVEKFDHPDHGWVWRECEIDWINARVEKAVTEEREVCAKVCDEIAEHYGFDGGSVSEHCAISIRERSNGQN